MKFLNARLQILGLESNFKAKLQYITNILDNNFDCNLTTRTSKKRVQFFNNLFVQASPQKPKMSN